jgi:thioredoxin reductase
MNTVEVAIIGAGPYGLSVAAHLRPRNVPFRIFGQPMQTWRPMPRNLSLKSLGFATNISVPERGHEFPQWLTERGLEPVEPVSYAHFAEYGLDMQRRFVPEVEPANVTLLELSPEGGYRLTLTTGEQLRARRVVVAVGLHSLQKLPEALEGFPRDLVSHSFGHYAFTGYAGKDVAVVGAGQSAFEAAVLLHEVGARPQLISRQTPIFYDRTPLNRSLLERMSSPMTVLGAGRMHWVLANLPWLVFYAPEERRVRLARNYLGPAGAWWLKDRFLGKVPVRSPARIVSAREDRRGVVLRLSEGSVESEETFAHVVCATGFQYDLRRFPFLDRALAERLQLIQGRAPQLSRNFESSLPGVYFVGPISTYAFGPLFRFVCGAARAAPTVAAHIARQRGLPRPLPRRAAASSAQPPSGAQAA